MIVPFEQLLAKNINPNIIRMATNAQPRKSLVLLLITYLILVKNLLKIFQQICGLAVVAAIGLRNGLELAVGFGAAAAEVILLVSECPRR